LRHFVVSCCTDEPEIDIFTSPDLRNCHLVGTKEECRFLARTYHQISMPEEEFLMSH
jgi:hypothetical protein